MDELIAHIACRVGQRWIQLYSRLGLGARERYRFVCTHQDKPEEEKWRNCAHDTLIQWRKTVSDLDETVAMAQLLAALRKVVGFQEVADELALSHGITLELPSPLKAIDPEPSPLSTPPITIRRLASKIEGVDKITTEEIVSEQHSQMVVKGYASQDDSGNSFTSDTEPVTPSLTGRDTHESLKLDGILQCPVDLRNSTHKFAILDISQRLRADKWNAIARKLHLQEDHIQQIRKSESCIEERYYKTLKLWVKSEQDGATFATLQKTLKFCNQSAAANVMIRRLHTHGPTL